MRGYAGLNETCQREMSRAVRLALWDFQQGGALTGVCDADVGTVCQARLPALLREHTAFQSPLDRLAAHALRADAWKTVAVKRHVVCALPDCAHGEGALSHHAHARSAAGSIRR